MGGTEGGERWFELMLLQPRISQSLFIKQRLLEKLTVAFFLFCFYQRRVIGNCYLQVKQIHPSELVTTFNMLTFIINLQECNKICCFPMLFFFLFFISWRLITLQYCSGFCHTLTWISHGYTCIPHPNPPSHLPLHLIPLGLPSAPGLSTCLMHPTWAGDLFHPR